MLCWVLEFEETGSALLKRVLYM